jgi:uncharacterized protein YjlB
MCFSTNNPWEDVYEYFRARGWESIWHSGCFYVTEYRSQAIDILYAIYENNLDGLERELER